VVIIYDARMLDTETLTIMILAALMVGATGEDMIRVASTAAQLLALPIARPYKELNIGAGQPFAIAPCCYR
jgi:hypothetical protein